MSEIDFKSTCPCSQCNRGSAVKLIYWIDSNCKHHYKLTKSGKLKCNGYNCYNNYESDILGVKFNCQNHEIQRGAYHPNCCWQGLMRAISVAVQYGKDDDDDFEEDLLFSLFDQRKKYAFNKY